MKEIPHYFTGAINALISYGVERIEFEADDSHYTRMYAVLRGKRLQYGLFLNFWPTYPPYDPRKPKQGADSRRYLHEER